MAQPCAPRPETTRSKPRCSKPHRIWNTNSRPGNSGDWNGAKANCNSAPFPAVGPMFRPVAGLEAGTVEPVMSRWSWQQFQAGVEALRRQQEKETKNEQNK